MSERALTITDVAKRLQVSEKKVRDLINSGELPHRRVGTLIRVAESVLDRFIRGEVVMDPILGSYSNNPARLREMYKTIVDFTTPYAQHLRIDDRVVRKAADLALGDGVSEPGLSQKQWHDKIANRLSAIYPRILRALGNMGGEGESR